LRFVERERINLLDLAFGVNNRDREETGTMKIDIEIEEASIESIDPFSAALGDISIS